MKCWILLSLLCGIISFPQWALCAQEVGACNPKPAEGDLVLPGPSGTCFAFRPISVQGKGPLAGQGFIMGDADSDSFRSPPTKAVIGGSFASEEDENIWIFYLGKYEVSRAQYKALMGKLPESIKDDTPENENLPITNINFYEAMAFTNALNQWFYANVLDKMPKSGKYPGFVRLPTEIEWEFAARGGRAVKASVFEAPHPYGDAIAEHEHYKKQETLAKPKAIGSLAANPLGLHDMLGNVQEMTLAQYQFEYYQGRSGGFVSRGNAFYMEEDELHVAQRQEEPYYLVRGKGIYPNAKAILGMRLILTAPLLTDNNAINEFSDAWEEYRAGAGSQNPAALSIAPTSTQENVALQDALVRIEKLRSDADASKILKQELAQTKIALEESLKIRSKADSDAAQTWLRQAMFWGQRIQNGIVRLARDEKNVVRIKNPERAAKRQRQIEAMKLNLEDMLEAYRDSILSMSDLQKKYIDEAFALRIKEEHQKVAQKKLSEGVAKESLEVLGVVKKNYDFFSKHKRADLKQWQADFMDIAKK